MKRVVLLAAALALCGSAQAQFLNGNQLLHQCDNYPASAVGYILGAVDTIQLSQDNGFVLATVCIRHGATGRQLSDIVCQFIRSNPTFRDFNAASLVSLSLSQSFPCQ